MTLDVIGAGFGRTGTLSLKTGLERLGFDRCYHMYEVMAHLEHAKVWSAAGDGEDVDFVALFDGYRATVDWPACVFWRELMAVFPDAKVLLSVRPSERWLASFKSTIYQVMTREMPGGIDLPEAFTALSSMAEKIVRDRSFGAGFAELDDAGLVAAYEAHNQAVRDSVPADRLLEFDVAQGWEPLCAFLGVAVPDEPFPNMNDTAMFRQLFGLDGEEQPADADAAVDEVQARFRAALPE
jgi:hypothetical protein